MAQYKRNAGPTKRFDLATNAIINTGPGAIELPSIRLCESTGCSTAELASTIRMGIHPANAKFVEIIQEAVRGASPLIGRVLSFIMSTSVFKEESVMYGEFADTVGREPAKMLTSWPGRDQDYDPNTGLKSDAVPLMTEDGKHAQDARAMFLVFHWLPWADALEEAAKSNSFTEMENRIRQLRKLSVERDRKLHAARSNNEWTDPEPIRGLLRTGEYWPLLHEALPMKRALPSPDQTDVALIRLWLFQPSVVNADELFGKLVGAAEQFASKYAKLKAGWVEEKKNKGERPGKKKNQEEDPAVVALRNDAVYQEKIKASSPPEMPLWMQRLVKCFTTPKVGMPHAARGAWISDVLRYMTAGEIEAPHKNHLSYLWKLSHNGGSVSYEESFGQTSKSMWDQLDGYQMEDGPAYMDDVAERVGPMQQVVGAVNNLANRHAEYSDADDADSDMDEVDVLDEDQNTNITKFHDWLDTPDQIKGSVSRDAEDVFILLAQQTNVPCKDRKVLALLSPQFFFNTAASFAHYASCDIADAFIDFRSYFGDIYNSSVRPDMLRLDEMFPVGRERVVIQSLRMLARSMGVDLSSPGPLLVLKKQEVYRTHVMRVMRTLTLHRRATLSEMTAREKLAYDTPGEINALLASHFTGFPDLSRVFVYTPNVSAPWNLEMTPRVDFLFSSSEIYLALGCGLIPRTLQPGWDNRGREFRRELLACYLEIGAAMSLDLLCAQGLEVQPSIARQLPAFPEPSTSLSAIHSEVLDLQKYLLKDPFESSTNKKTIADVIHLLKVDREVGRLLYMIHPPNRTLEFSMSPRRVEILREMAMQWSPHLATVLRNTVSASSTNDWSNFSDATQQTLRQFYIRNSDIMLIRYHHDALDHLVDTISATARRSHHPDTVRLVESLYHMVDAMKRDAFKRMLLNPTAVSDGTTARLPPAYKQALSWYYSLPNGENGRWRTYPAQMFGNLSLGGQYHGFWTMFMGEVARLHSNIILATQIRFAYVGSNRFQASTTTQRGSILVPGPTSTGKSITMKKVADTGVPGLTMDVAHATTRAFNTSDSILDGYRFIMEEVGQDMLGGQQSNNDKVTAFKQRIESSLVITYAYDSDTAANGGSVAASKRDAKLVYCSCQCANILGTNENLRYADKAVLSRFIVIIIGELDESDQPSGYKLTDQVIQGYRDEDYEKIADDAGRNTLRLHDFYAIVIHKMIQSRICPDVTYGRIKSTLAEVLARVGRLMPTISSRLVRTLGHMLNTIYTSVINRATGICMTEGIVDSYKYYDPKARVRNHEQENVTGFDYNNQVPATRDHVFDLLLTEAPKLLYATKEDLIFALTLMKEDIDRSLRKQIMIFFASAILKGDGLAGAHVLRTPKAGDVPGKVGSTYPGNKPHKNFVYNFNYLLVRPPPGTQNVKAMMAWLCDQTSGHGVKRMGIEQLEHIVYEIRDTMIEIKPWQDMNARRAVAPWTIQLDALDTWKVDAVPATSSHQAPPETVEPLPLTSEVLLARADQAAREETSISTEVFEQFAQGSLSQAPLQPAGGATANRGNRAQTHTSQARAVNVDVNQGAPVWSGPASTSVAAAALLDVSEVEEPIKEPSRVASLIIGMDDEGPFMAVLDQAVRPFYQVSTRGGLDRPNGSPTKASQYKMNDSANISPDSASLPAEEEGAPGDTSGVSGDDDLDESSKWTGCISRDHDPLQSQLLSCIGDVLETASLEKYPDEVYKALEKSFKNKDLWDTYGILMKRDDKLAKVPNSDEDLSTEIIKYFVESCPFEHVIAVTDSRDAINEFASRYANKTHRAKPHRLPYSHKYFRTYRLMKRKNNKTDLTVLSNHTLPLKEASDILAGSIGAAAQIYKDSRLSPVRSLEYDLDFMSYKDRCEVLRVQNVYDLQYLWTIPWLVKMMAVRNTKKTGRFGAQFSNRSYPNSLFERMTINFMNDQSVGVRKKRKADSNTDQRGFSDLENPN